jgi:hypothetical protein
MEARKERLKFCGCPERGSVYGPHRGSSHEIVWGRDERQNASSLSVTSLMRQSTCLGLAEGMLASCNQDSLHAELVFLMAARSSVKVAQ